MKNESFKHNESDKITWTTAGVGEFLFSFDDDPKHRTFNLFRDYPKKLTSEQKRIFDEENPRWKEFFKNRH